MARSVRMFEIIQLLRSAQDPITAQTIAAELEVTVRTVYRDIASLQATRVPIEGAAGIGYVMRTGFELPPINFDVEEAEAITVGLAMIARTGDKGLKRAARRAGEKLAEATQLSSTVFASTWGPEEPKAVDMSDIRQAIRDERKLRINYTNGDGISSERIILPIAIAYHSEVIVLAAWCELRDGFRNFRPDRFSGYAILPDTFVGRGDELRAEWIKGYAAWL